MKLFHIQEGDGMLENYFPQTKKLLGTDLFSELAKNYHSEDYSTFPQYLKENLPDIETRHSYIPELSRLEFTIYTGQADYQEFHPMLQSVRPLQIIEDAKRVNISLSPNIRLFKSRFPVWEIWKECHSSTTPPDLINFDLQPKIKNPYFYVIDQNGDGPMAYSVRRKVFQLIEGILQGNSFGTVAEKLYSHKEPIVLAKALSKIHSLKLIENYRVDQR
jgi:hypothetical protein